MNGIHEVTGSIPVWSTISNLLIASRLAPNQITGSNRYNSQDPIIENRARRWHRRHRVCQARAREHPTIRKGPLKGRRIELAPTTGVDALETVAEDFMRKIFSLEPGEYLIADLSSLYDFIGVDDMQMADLLARVMRAYGLDLADLPDGNLLKIFNRLREHRRRRDA